MAHLSQGSNKIENVTIQDSWEMSRIEARSRDYVIPKFNPFQKDPRPRSSNRRVLKWKSLTTIHFETTPAARVFIGRTLFIPPMTTQICTRFKVDGLSNKFEWPSKLTVTQKQPILSDFWFQDRRIICWRYIILVLGWGQKRSNKSRISKNYFVYGHDSDNQLQLRLNHRVLLM